MTSKSTNPFDDLIAGYYGTGRIEDPRQSVKDLLSSYYGTPTFTGRAAPPTARSALKAISMSLGHDDGTVIPSANGDASDGDLHAHAVSMDYEEYLIEVCPPEKTREDAQPAPAPAVASAPSAAPTPPAAPQPSIAKSFAADVMDAPRPPLPDVQRTAAPSDDDIFSDLQSIISGQKLYDKEAGGLVDRSSERKRDSAPAPAPETSTSQDIFDRIKQSMSYANAYDLGSVELENRFAQFDREDDARRKGGTAKKTNGSRGTPLVSEPYTPVAPPPQPAATTASVGTSEFLQDLDAMASVSTSQSSETQLAVPLWQDGPHTSMSRPFYDTGEHVLAGNDLYNDRLHVGKDRSVGFSYGQIIAMADLYESVDQMMAASTDELSRVKALIVLSTAYYAGRKTTPGLDVPNDRWDAATGGRYLKLAEDNYEHFSPAIVAMGSGVHTSRGDNRSTWERYHRRAIDAARDQYLNTNPNSSPFLEWPLTINAFGDHFLTDAFAAGHLINKEVMIDRFRTAFYSGNDLNSAGESFFEQVAKAAWHGDVARRFSDLETVDMARWHGFPLFFHPDINSASRFGEVLKAAANQQPTRVANLIVKALHDHLNGNGIEVTNAAGDGTWILPGDTTLMVPAGRLTQNDIKKTLGIMRKAVQQSIDDINSPAIRASNLNYAAFFNGVWRYVPSLTPASQSEMTSLIRDYTDPGSQTLVRAASAIISEQLNEFINVLIKEHKLRAA